MSTPETTAIPSELAAHVSETQPREAYAHSCKGKFIAKVTPTKRNTTPYSAFSLRSNARWFMQTIDGKQVMVANTMFKPAELAKLATDCVAAGVDRIEVAVFAPVADIPEPKDAEVLDEIAG